MPQPSRPFQVDPTKFTGASNAMIQAQQALRAELGKLQQAHPEVDWSGLLAALTTNDQAVMNINQLTPTPLPTPAPPAPAP